VPTWHRSRMPSLVQGRCFELAPVVYAPLPGSQFEFRGRPPGLGTL